MAKKPGKKSLKIWIEPDKHEAIKEAAKADRRTMTAWIMILVDKALEERAIEEAKRKNERR